jgi:hypothetical protein
VRPSEAPTGDRYECEIKPVRVRKGPKSGMLHRLRMRRNPLSTRHNSRDGYPLSGEGCGDTQTGSFPGRIVLEESLQRSEEDTCGSNPILSAPLRCRLVSFTNRNRADNCRRGCALGKRTLIYKKHNSTGYNNSLMQKRYRTAARLRRRRLHFADRISQSHHSNLKCGGISGN